MRTPTCKICGEFKTCEWKPYMIKNKAGLYDQWVKRKWICKTCKTEGQTKTIQLTE